MGKKKCVWQCNVPLPIFDEDSAAFVGWNCVLMLATMWSCVNGPLSVGRSSSWYRHEEGSSFLCGEGCSAALRAVSHITDLVFLGEVFVRFLFPIYDTEAREIVDDHKAIRDRYVHHPRFLVNVRKRRRSNIQRFCRDHPSARVEARL